MTRSNIYLDFNATTPINPLVREKLGEWAEYWGNPSSIHAHGRGPKKLMRESRRSLASQLNCHPLELIFTSGGSEANNLALQGVLKELKGKSQRRKLVLGSIEHPSILKQTQALEEMGFEVILVPVSREGFYDMEFYKAQVDEDTALVSVMLANNELGVIAPLQEMVEWAHEKGAYFHSDCVQALGKMSFDLKELGVDLASFSSHKVYALKGTGLLYAKKGTPLQALVFGGAQERYRRAGTENLLSIASLAFMVEQLDTPDFVERMGGLKRDMEAALKERIQGLSVLAEKAPRLANTTTLYVEGVNAESLLMNLDIRGFSVGTGAACSSGNPEPSPVLLSMGLTRQEAQSTLRVSLGSTTTQDEVHSFVENLCEVVDHLRRLSSERLVNERI